MKKTRRMVLCANCKTIQRVDLNDNFDGACPICGKKLIPSTKVGEKNGSRKKTS